MTRLLLKAHISGYTRKDGVYVAPHEDRRAVAKHDAHSKAGPLTDVERARWEELRNEFAKWDGEKKEYVGMRNLTEDEKAEKDSYSRRHSEHLKAELKQAQDANGERNVKDAPSHNPASEDSHFGFSQNEARSVVEDDGDAPDGWFLHGRRDGDKLTDNWPIQMTTNSSVANGYAGDSGSVWAIRSNSKTRVADFSDYNSADLDEFIDALKNSYEAERGEVGSPIGDVVAAIAQRDDKLPEDVYFSDFEDYVRDAFTPADIVSSAGAFDSDTDMALLSHYHGGWPDLVKTPDGAVVMPGSVHNLDAVNLSSVARGGSFAKAFVVINADPMTKAHVKGYSRKDGTYVPPHERKDGPGAAPRAPVVHHPRLSENGSPVQIKNPTHPSSHTTWHNPKAVATFVPDGDVPMSINGIPIRQWKDHPRTLEGWEYSDGVNHSLYEPPFHLPPGKHAGAGVVIIEPDGRVWLAHPSNGFGGYQATWPKGSVDPGESMQAAACRETFEETGLQVEIIGHLGDFEKTTSMARMYLAKRVGGDPTQMGWESQSMSLCPLDRLRDLLNMPNDHAIVEALEAKLSSSKDK